MLKENNSTETKTDKPIGGKAGFIIGCVIIYWLALGIVWGCVSLPGAIDKMSQKSEIKNSKVVLYDGPKSLKDATAEDLSVVSEAERDMSLKHCTDTKVTVNGNDCYVYDTNVNNTHAWVGSYMPKLSRTPITYFDFEGTVEITVKAENIDIKSVTVRPLKYDIKPEINTKDHTVTFRVNTPDTYTVEFNNSTQRAVHIFANELENPEDIPDAKDDDVFYIGPGEWNIENMVLSDNQTLYISGGAVVHGIANANFAKNVTVCGRGIIDNSNLEGWKGRSASVPLKFDNCQDVTIDGIISLNSNAWCLQVYNTIGADINNVKILTARPNGDGMSIQSTKSAKITNSFVRAWDDALVVKNYDENSANISFKNIQVWTDLAQSMEIGYETNKGQNEKSTITNVSFEDITILHNFHKPALSIHNADDAAVSDIKYKNIVVEDAEMGRGDGTTDLIDFSIVKNDNWSSTQERGTISNVTIDGFKVLDGAKTLMVKFKGYDAEHNISDVTIKGLNIKGESITNDSKCVSIDANTTSNIKIEK
ncbi:hypothetical protein DWW50_09345 [Eubacterium sp. AF15-50]|uniref:Glycosyl hydrolases family 28 n=1 Tax=Eubacterium segne TaxID=2763045 RepID=A0ABR7F510_9FIRM|nr:MULTISPECIES: glycosyl hydrolase family 28 protein [Eubacterium]MBC5668691.1 hypothetical protein [Eubacterium segne]RHR70852.1 hypothetical protein DWW68_09900 [Eubacterium sp. AF16-48]RHR78195.1 hypothetical protein DWW50_09345 [Eubacterium sp. AF15-50]